MEIPSLFPLLMATDFEFCCRPAPSIFPAKKSMSIVADSVARYLATSKNSTVIFCRQFRRWYENFIVDRPYYVADSVFIWSFFVVVQEKMVSLARVCGWYENFIVDRPYSVADSVFIWSLFCSGSREDGFTGKSFTLAVMKEKLTNSNTIIDNLVSLAWQKLSLPKLAISGKFNTMTPLHKKGLLDYHKLDCVFCHGSLEDTDHLFLSCTVSWCLWTKQMKLWNVCFSPSWTLRQIWGNECM